MKNVEDLYPLSPTQQGMLVHALRSPGEAVYVEQYVCLLRGDLDSGRFRAAWQKVVDRHPILRTAFLWEGLDEPLQVVRQKVEVPWTEEDWSGLPEGERAARLEALTAADLARGFDPVRAPLLRLTLLRLDDRRHRLVWTFHHLILEGWSLGLVLDEVAAAYEGRLDSAPRRPYREFIEWLRRQDPAPADDFWRREMAGFVSPTPLGIDTPGVGSRGAGQEELRLSASLTESLQALARRNRVTLYTVVEAAWALLLSRYSGEEDVVFGVTVAGRPEDLPGSDRMVGLFINTVPVRAQASPERTLAGFLEEQGRRRRARRPHEHAPLIRIREASEVPRDRPLFESLLVFENAPRGGTLGTLEVVDVRLRERTNYPLTLLAFPDPEGLLLRALFDRPRLEPGAVRRLLGHLAVLLEELASRPEARLEELTPLTPAEREWLLVDWLPRVRGSQPQGAGSLPDVSGSLLRAGGSLPRGSGSPSQGGGSIPPAGGSLPRGERSLPRAGDSLADGGGSLLRGGDGPTLHGLVLAQAARTPDAVALIADGRRWTYRELVSRAAAVARRLHGLGVGPEVPVGICVERSAEMVAGILGTLLAGGAYVPIDPSYPEERRAWMLEDSGARVLLDDLSGLGEAEPFASPAGPGGLAYIIYTSGSTGRPKGVAVEHRSAVAMVHWAQTVFPPEDLAGVFASTSICFDLSVFELFVPLATGGTVILGRDALELANLGTGVTLVNTVPSAMAELLRMGAVPPSVRTVNLAGEPLRRSLVDRVLALGTVGRVLNLYGPSEDTTYSTWEEVGLDGEPTLGRPVTGTRAAVLGPDGSLQPAGIPGELVLGGAGLARGYWNRPDRTAERFVPDPFSDQPGERLYRTGDLVRRVPGGGDGRLELLGRIDHQVKLRGFRIELGEVETALARLPGVREAVAAVREDRLVAWVLGDTLSAAALRDALRNRLPEFMVPSAFVFLDDLPRTPTGKVDRRALPDPVQAGPEREMAPRTPTEELVAAVWCEILGRERVGRHDDFFLLGGHSLLAARVVHRLREALRVRLPIQAVFSEPTLAGLARKIDEAAREDLPPIGKADRDEPLPASFAQERLWFLHQLQPGLTAYNLPVTVALQGELDADALERALNEIVRRHEVLRTVYASQEGRTVQIVLPDLSIPMPRIDLSGAPRETVLELAAREAARPFDLTAGPLIRALLVRLGEGEHALLLTLHHIVTDLWSFGVLLRELASLYAGSPLPELSLQYADYAVWQRAWLHGETLDRLVDPLVDRLVGGWREILAGAPPAIELPTDRPHPEVPSGRGGRVHGRLEPIRREGATLFMSLLAVWSALLHRVTGQDDLTVGTPVAGRTRTELEDLIGFFVNTLVLRMDLSDDPPFGALVDRARDRALDAYALQDLPFEMLVEALRPPRDTGRNPLFQVMLTLQNAPLPELRIGDLALVPLEVETGTAQFDLALTLVEDMEGLSVALEYNADLFDPATAGRLLAAFQTLARGADPERRVGDLPLLSDIERGQLLEQHRPASAPRLLHRLIEAQVERAPDAEAVILGNETLTYRELDQRANGLAHRLRRLGVGPETPVAVCLPASVDWVVSMLGILKAGGYYVPLDPTHPAQRREQLLRLSGARVALLDSDGQSGSVETPQSVIRNLTGSRNVGASPTSQEPIPPCLAYAIYTSGSTGEPKAVGVSHAAAAEHSDVFGRALSLGPGDRVLQFFSWAFDASTEQVFPTLAHGAAVVLKTEEPWSPAEFTDRLAELGITVLDLPAAFWHEWVQAGVSPEKTRLRHVIAGGAALPPESARLWTATGLPLWNGYGPTEAVVTALVFQASPGWPGLSDAVRIPIGHDLPHRSSYILDRGGQPLPPGLPGELCLGGTLARGYLGRPDLTAERFVPHPWSPVPGERLYRTGDLARRGPDGIVEFLGRVDTQVKIRGFRIEIGEVETAVAALPGVRQAAVLVRGEGGRQRLVAFIVPEGEPDLAAMRATLQERLPAYMVPATWVVLPEMPVNRSGKIDRKALATLDDEERRASGVFAPPGTGVERRLAEIWREALGVETVGLDDSFFDLGGHSMLLSRVLGPTREALGRDVSLMDLFRYPTIRSLAGIAARATQEREPVRRTRHTPQDGAIAIVGMACRLPGAPDVETFWSNLRDGVESITFFSDEELLRAGVDPRFLADPQYVRALGTLGDVSGFDARFFGYTPREAAMMDPQQRLFLQVAWEACEVAGIDPSQSAGRIGVFAGQGAQDYLLQNIARSPLARDTGAAFQIGIGNEGSFLPTRVSYKLGLTGPSVHVQSACSTSLVAVHLACRSILAGECDAALAGGCTILLPTTSGYFSEDGGVQARDGHLRAFDADGTGFVPASGAGAVLLKTLAAALADGDRIRAVIRGSAINNDGAFKIGFTAPSVEGQAAVISEALDAAGVGPDTIGYVEAHGTATPLGDPIEVEALTQAFRAGTSETGFCALGSVKTNIGHTDTAAGIAGLIKTVLMLEHGLRVPSLHFSKPNPAIDFESSPFYVGTRTEPWTGSPRRAGVSSFGLGGTNAHVILEEPPRQDAEREVGRSWQLLTLSARTAKALDAATAGLAAFLERRPETLLEDVALTLHTGRRRFEHRRVLVASSLTGAAEALGSLDPETVATAREERSGRPVVFLFPGGGAQHPDMGQGLYETEPVYRAEIDRCAEIVLASEGWDLREPLAPEHLRRTREGLPSLFAVEYALARLWMSWGVAPQAMIGHSLGEYASACLAGVFTLEEAMALVVLRGKLFERLPAGGMLSVPRPESELGDLLGPDVSFAAVNGPSQTVLSGTNEAMDAAAARLSERGIEHRRIHIDVAAHSHLVEPILADFQAFAAGLALRPPSIPFLSNVTGTWITPEEATSPAYWARHLRQTVRFGDGVRELLCEPDRVFLEVGPGHTLSTLVQQHPDRTPGQAVVASMRHPHDPRPDSAFLLNALGRLWLAGADVDWDGFHAGQPGRRTPLPTYPFERQRCWIESEASVVLPQAGLVKRPDPVEWLYAPAWKPAPLPVAPATPQRWLFLLDGGLGEEVAARMRQDGHQVTTTRSLPEGSDFDRIADFRADFHALLDLARALARRSEPASIVAVSTGVQRVTGEEELVPERAALLGPCRVIPQEYPHLACRSVDVDLPEGWKRARLVDQLAAELAADTSEPAVALRGGERWARAFEPIASAPVRLRERGVYLITGGLGSLGLQVAEHLARTVRARLVLTGRNARKSPEIQRIEALGATVEVRAADVADLEAMDGVLAWIDETWGELHGIFHAAGVAGSQGVALIQDRDSGEAHFRAKLRGAAVLERVLRGRPLDFCLLFSSLSSVLGGLGLAAYAGANAALDAFAQRHNQRFPVRWTSVAWETWQASGLPPQVAAFAVTPAEGLAVLDRLLGLGPVTQVLVSTGDLALRMRGTSPETVEEEAVPEDIQADRGDLTTAYAAPRTDLERELAAAWSSLFGIARIGIHDGFFEMGGHSLLAVQLLNRLHRTYGVELPVRSLFENPTIARFAQVIATATGREQAPEGPPLRDRIRAAAPGERRPLLVQWLREKLALAAGLQPEDVPEEGLPAGVDLERMVTDLILSLRRDFDVPFYPNEIVARPSVGELADYLAAELFQDTPSVSSRKSPPLPGRGGWEEREHRERPSGGEGPRGPQNPRMVFLLSAPRSGSTLTRVMLAGHPALFAPPELDLLQHADMKSWAEEVHETPTRAMGLNRTLMELEGLTEEEARLRIHALVERNASVQEVFRLIQDETGGRLLVDKSPGYALLSRTLQRAEELFEEPLYLYLYRHPAAMIESFLRNRLHRTYASSDTEPQEVAEHIWLRCNRNIRDFLAGVDPRRRFDLRYEELVSDPERILRGVCDFLGIPFDAGVLDPYGGGRMIDGSGDPNITDRNRVDPRLGEAWKKARLPRELDPEVRRMAMDLGYEVDQPIRKAPLSFQQQRLWFLARLHPDSSAYNLPLHVRLTGPLRVPALTAAVGEVMRRHEILRTVFSLEGGEPVQSVLAPRPAHLPRIDLSGLPDPERELERLARAEAEQPFDLATGPLLRSSLVRLGKEAHALLLVLHHIVTDGWSNALLLAEIAALYQGKSLPELPLQYADYAAAQRERLQGERLETLLGWWRERLAGAPTALDLPTDRPRPRIATARGGAREAPLPETLPDRLQAVSQRHGASLFMTLLASFAALLYRVSGQDDLLIGTPITERNRQEMEGMIGFLVNSLVIRVDLSGDPGFGELLDRVRETALGAYAHQELPFERLVEELQPERDLSRNPLYQAGFALNHERPGRVELPGLTLSTLETAIDNIKFDLSLAAQESRTGPWHFFWQWSADLFDPSTVMRLHRQAVALLDAALADPGRPLSDLPLTDGSERRQILAPAARFQVTGTLHRLFEAQAARAPGATAVVFENERLTYGELDVRADRWASRLRELGVGPEVRVGLRAERSLGLIVGLLAILKAGGAYVPLDPAYPEERLRFLVEDSGVRVVLTQDDLDGEIPASGPVSGIEPDPDNLAYVIYTSGSTGRPKGVGVTHANVVRLFLSSETLFRFGPSDTWTLFHSHAFDFSVWEIWGALLHGGTLVVVPYGVSRSPSAFRELLVRERVTVLNQTPSAFRQLVEADARAGGGLALRHVIFGGEALDLPSLAPWFERHGDETPRLVNMYGITETTVHVTWRPVSKADLRRGSVIGSPLPDLSLALLDRRLEPVPEGVPGEIHVGGAGLARGYLGRPELTAERFVPDPWSPEPGARLYRSGDLARALPDGDLEYRGRIDHQVKIRGFRVEPGEIERVLAQHPSVRQAAVLARPEEGDLVAYVVLQQEDPTLRSYLKERLPDYMVPSFIVRLDAMPLTSNNKLDLRALARLRPEPERRRLAEPADEMEAVIAGVWKEVLGISEIGVEDNFFDLGGHSMRMVKIEGRLREVLGREVPLVDLFRYPTVRSLARHLFSPSLPSLQPLPSFSPSGAVAIVGMAGRFPGAPDLAAFWENLRAGVESVVRLSEADLEAEGIAPERFRRPEYVPAHGVLEDVELFDAPFFGISPREAELMDPQHRFFLECAWEALEDAGLMATDRVGVFAGSSSSSYLLRNLASHPDLLESVGAFQLGLHGERDFLATRVSYKLGLTGPSMTIQTSCSTSLVAVHVACRSLLARECDAALAGGVSIGVPQRSGYVYQEGGILSPEGRCRAFDAAARGTVGGSGAGVVVLKRLEDALAAGDPIRAVIRGSAVNNDGSLKAGFTAPSVGGQARVIGEALAAAGLDPAGIGLVEAHGTGTELGDPIEVAALAEAFGEVSRGSVAIGSVKTNIGHLDAAAGVAGLIKAVLAVENGEIPPSLHFEEPNPRLGLDRTPFFVNTRLREWPEGTRRAGVSSFGMGGTNVHLVLEQAPESAATTEPTRPDHLLVLSARTPAALDCAAERLAVHLRSHPEQDLADIAYTLQTARRAFPHRRAFVVRDREDGLVAIEGRAPSSPRKVAFLLSGQGSQHAGMARGLYDTERVFREAFDRCREILDLDLLSATDDELRQTGLAQPALFAVEYALARLWMDWGVRPQALIGHSIGELVAACLAGVFTLEDALALVAARGRLMAALPAGAMLAVLAPAAEVEPRLGPGLSLAAVNSPAHCVVSGPSEAVAGFAAELERDGIETRPLHTSHAFHSPSMEPAAEPFERLVAGVRREEPRIPFLSNVTGTWITPEEAIDPAYWARQLLRPVRFADGLAALLAEGELALLEVGPGRALATFARQHPSRPLAVPSLPHPRDGQEDMPFLLGALGRLWTAGVEVDWQAFHRTGRRRVRLPTYPFERHRYWIEASHVSRPVLSEAPPAPVLHERPGNLPSAYEPPATEIERGLCEAWQTVLGIGEIGIRDNFFDLGGDSLLAPRVLQEIRGIFGVELPLRFLFDTPTIAELAAPVEALLQEQELVMVVPVDFPSEAVLDPSVLPEGPGPDPDRIERPREVVLTGSTGFLGAYLLGELLRRTEARIHCVVRAQDTAEGLDRIRRRMTAAGLWSRGAEARVVAVPGDLEQERWGLSEDDFTRLAGLVDAIYHCGAWVNFTYPYAALKAANVGSTREALRLAGHVRTKPLHLVSSTAAVSALGITSEDPVVWEDGEYPTYRGLFTGYGSTKWVAEQHVLEARRRGIPVNIYRPGTLAGDSRTGFGNPRDMIWNMMKSCIQIGAVPEDPQRATSLDVTPVNYVAAAIVHLSLQPERIGGTFHFPNPRPLSWDEVYDFARAYGYTVRTVPFEEWDARLAAALGQDTDNALAPFAPLIAWGRAGARSASGPPAQIPREPRFDDQRTRAGLEGSGIVCPPLGKDLLRTLFDWLVGTGFLPEPPETEPDPDPVLQGREEEPR